MDLAPGHKRANTHGPVLSFALVLRETALEDKIEGSHITIAATPVDWTSIRRLGAINHIVFEQFTY